MKKTSLQDVETSISQDEVASSITKAAMTKIKGGGAPGGVTSTGDTCTETERNGKCDDYDDCDVDS